MARPAAWPVAGRAEGALPRAGLELTAGELPDYLPVVLEYAATGDLADGLRVLQEHRAGVELTRLALQEAGSPYAAALEAICTLLPGPSPRDQAAAGRHRTTGPPQETVGLAAAAPYPLQQTEPVEGARR
jgi:nitrate reductase delta subunit